MSASERLRALDGLAPTFPPDADVASEIRPAMDALATVRNALPLIADYVSATEAYFAAHDRGEQGHRAHVREKYEKLTEALDGSS